MPTALPLFQARPPYTDFAPTGLTQPHGIGDVLAVLISRDTAEHTVRQTARRVIHAAPAAAILAVYPGKTTDGPRITQMAAAASLGVVALDARPLEPALRKTLTRLERFPRAFRQWLQFSGVTREERLIKVLGRVFDHAALIPPTSLTSQLKRAIDWPSVPQMAEFVGLTPRGLRDAFARSKLPSPVQWKVFARDLIHAILIQSDATTPLSRLALRLGYADSHALAHAFQHSFGVTPTLVRECLGWQWLALKWSERHGSVRNRQLTAVFDHARVRGPRHDSVAASGTP